MEALLRAHLDYLNANDLLDGVRYASGRGLIVVADDETLAYLLERAEGGEWDVSPEQVTAVLEAHLEYLTSVGVIGAAVPDPAALDDGEGDDRPSSPGGA